MVNDGRIQPSNIDPSEWRKRIPFDPPHECQEGNCYFKTDELERLARRVRFYIRELPRGYKFTDADLRALEDFMRHN